MIEADIQKHVAAGASVIVKYRDSRTDTRAEPETWIR
jgi:hypothetical protein